MTLPADILDAVPTGQGSLGERFFLQIVDYDGAPRAVIELTSAQYELAASFIAPRVDPSSPDFDPTTDPRSPSYDRVKADTAEALFERALERAPGLSLSRAELKQAKGVITLNFD